MPAFKVGLIGTGGRCAAYAAAYRRRGGVEITGLVDPDPAHRRALAARAGLEGGYAEYEDWRDLLREQPDLDGAVVCSPNHLHAEHAIPCEELVVNGGSVPSSSSAPPGLELHAIRARESPPLIHLVILLDSRIGMSTSRPV